MQYSAEEKGIVYLAALSGKDLRECVRVLRAVGDPALLPELQQAENAEKLEAFLHSLEEDGLFAVTLVSADYPESLKALPDPPLVLYGAGNRELLKKRRFCIVGSRIIPPWAEEAGKRIARDVSREFCVVTGLAEGGDSAAIHGALESGNLICVLPCGLDECYPAAHESLKRTVRGKGLLLSEYLPHDPATKFAFHARNRLLAGLSEGVLVLAAAKRSGTLITANRALEYGRDVFALPHNANAAQGEGCNDLIKKGAYLVTESADVLTAYGFELRERTHSGLTEEEERVMEVLRGRGEMHAAEIAAALGMRVYELAAVLSSLEIKGEIVKSGGNQYSVT